VSPQAPIRGTVLTLAIFLDVTFVLCVTWGLLLPGIHARGVPVLAVVPPIRLRRVDAIPRAALGKAPPIMSKVTE